MRLFDAKTNEPITLPAERATRGSDGEIMRIERIAVSSSPGKSGKLGVTSAKWEGERLLYPTVFDCYIADGAREEATV